MKIIYRCYRNLQIDKLSLDAIIIRSFKIQPDENEKLAT